MNYIHRLTMWLVALVFVAAIAAPPGNAQSRNPQPQHPGSPKPGDELRPDSIRERQFKMAELEREAANQPMSPEAEKLAMAQIAEDYREIQIINNKMMASAVSSSAPNYASIVVTLSEIRTRALRLKTNLGLSTNESAPKKEKWQPATGAAELKKALIALDKSIMSFVESPIFKTPAVVNVEDSTKARHNLENIIEWSALIKKDSERLKKASNP